MKNKIIGWMVTILMFTMLFVMWNCTSKDKGTDFKEVEMTSEQYPDPIFKENKETIVSSFNKVSWVVTYEVHVNKVHTNGYIIIKQVEVGDKIFTYGDTLAINQNVNYIEWIHSMLKAMFRQDVVKHVFTIRDNTPISNEAFSVMRTAECIIIACKNENAGEVTWDKVMKVHNRIHSDE